MVRIVLLFVEIVGRMMLGNEVWLATNTTNHRNLLWAGGVLERARFGPSVCDRWFLGCLGLLGTASDHTKTEYS